MVGLHACICQRIMWHVSVSPLLFKFQIKKMDRSTFSMLIHVGFYGQPSFYTCFPRFICPCKIMNSISVDVFICHCSALWLKTVCELNIRVKSYQKKETWKPPLSPSLTGEIVLDLLAVLPKPWIFCMADMFLCHYINVTKIVCELDPRAKKLLYLCSCPYVSMLELSLYLCPYVSMPVPLCFYDRNFFYAHILMFLCP